jgi:two-component system, NarL family, nitrate/nitrite response regulator NarL
MHIGSARRIRVVLDPLIRATALTRVSGPRSVGPRNDVLGIVAAAAKTRHMRRDRRPRVAIAAESRVFRDALARALPRYGLAIVESPAKADVLLVDVAEGARLAPVRDLAATHADTPLLGIGVRDTERDVLACIEAGAVGYVLQDATLDELADAAHRALRDEPLASPHMIATLMRRVAALSQNGRLDTVGTLTSRELEIVALIEQGCSNKEIAAHLSIAVTTVKNHVHSILEKLRVHRRGEIAWVVRNVGPSG